MGAEGGWRAGQRPARRVVAPAVSRRHRFRPVDFLVPVVVSVVLVCLAVFWAPSAGKDWSPFRGSVGGGHEQPLEDVTPRPPTNEE